MSLLNIKFPFIETYTEPTINYFSGKTQPSIGLALLHDFQKTTDIWYCMITTDCSLSKFPIRSLMGEEHYRKIVNKTAYVVLDLSFEPFLDAIDSIYQHVIINGKIPASQVIFMSAMYDAVDFNKTAAVRYNSEPIKIFYFSSLEVKVQHEQNLANSVPLRIKSYEKKFLNLNRRWRIHRPMLTVLLHHRKLLDKGFVSFGPCENQRSWDTIWNYMLHLSSNNAKMSSAIKDSEDIKNKPWMYLDTDEFDTNRANSQKSMDKFYHNSYFSVVSETTFHTDNPARNSRFITEKTYKAILMRHPFILVTIPKSLEVLKNLGYKTFSPWINEDYDVEMDDNKRMMMIVDEIERLSNLNDDELKLFLSNVIGICEYNYKKLISQSKFIYDRENGNYV